MQESTVFTGGWCYSLWETGNQIGPRETKTLINLIDRLTKFQSFEFEMIRLKTALEMRLLMATYISWWIYMHFPREQKSQHPLIWTKHWQKWRNRVQKQVSMNQITQKFTSANLILLCSPVLIKIWDYLFSSIHFRVWGKSEKRKMIQNILIKPHLCTKHIRAKSDLWKQVSSCVR